MPFHLPATVTALNSGEGLRRIATIIRVVGWLVTAFVAVAIVFTFKANELHIGHAFAFAVMTVGPIAIAYGLAWIIDGFAAPRQN